MFEVWADGLSFRGGPDLLLPLTACPDPLPIPSCQVLACLRDEEVQGAQTEQNSLLYLELVYCWSDSLQRGIKEELGMVREKQQEQVGGDGRAGKTSPAAAGCRIGSAVVRAYVPGCWQPLAGVTQEMRGLFCRPPAPGAG